MMWIVYVMRFVFVFVRMNWIIICTAERGKVSPNARNICVRCISPGMFVIIIAPFVVAVFGQLNLRLTCLIDVIFSICIRFSDHRRAVCFVVSDVISSLRRIELGVFGTYS